MMFVFLEFFFLSFFVRYRKYNYTISYFCVFGVVFVTEDPVSHVSYITYNWDCQVINFNNHNHIIFDPQTAHQLYENSSKMPLEMYENALQNHDLKFQLAYLTQNGKWELQDEWFCACQFPQDMATGDAGDPILNTTNTNEGRS